VSDRAEIEDLLRRLYAARLGGDLDGLCRAFTQDAKFKIVGVSRHVSPVAVTAVGIGEIRQWLSLLLKTFQLSNQSIRSMIIENDKAAVQWQANIYSKITGTSVPTELVDLIETRNGQINSYTEFALPQ
jgi:ketosteroid isomerase-like protein